MIITQNSRTALEEYLNQIKLGQEMSSAEKENNKDVSKKTEPRRIATPRQLEFLIDFLRDNETLRFGRIHRSIEDIQLVRRLWDMCAEKLNRMGPSRSAKEWAKYWSDLKSRTKQKREENKRISIVGEGSSSARNLNYAEKRIVRLLEHDEQRRNGHDHEVPLDQSSGGSSQESINFFIKEEKEDDNIEALDMNVEDFISIAPVVEDITASPSDKLPPLQPASNHARSINISLPLPPSLQTPISLQAVQSPYPPAQGSYAPAQGPYAPAQDPYPAAQGLQSAAANVKLSPNNPDPAANNLQSGDKKQPPRDSPMPKRRRRRARVVVPSHTNRSCLNPECINCIELKEFCDVMLKLEESHAKTTKLQTEASLKMTEVLKLQAEGILHTGVALREMATNLCRLMEGQALTGRTITI